MQKKLKILHYKNVDSLSIYSKEIRLTKLVFGATFTFIKFFIFCFNTDKG